MGSHESGFQLGPSLLEALPPYSVRESNRARHVSLKVHLNGRVEVVVPRGFNQEQVPALLQRRREWLWQMVGQLQASMEEDHFTTRPGQIELRSRQQTWRVLYQERPTGEIRLSQPQPLTLVLGGSINNSAGCSQLLRQWLGRKARAELAPWLRELSFDLNLPFRRISIRGQKTRWASCSSQGDISLNYKLLFLPTDLVHYVFVHELCHTIHMNHSSGFWRLVAEKYPAYGTARGQLKEGWRYVPGWVEG
ncbi:MAG: M48 family metallopeptidase [Nodosilinea sp.]